ncbi:MAG: hypothetical protein K2W82_01970 [Candidatus Obscuribacterales bacterium]|nr:hypothetical protein [Candidatus Obscuribacterales bacterium]
MPEDVIAKNKLEREAVVAAIDALRSRGDDLNPYSLADELRVSHTVIVSSGETMQLIAQGRGEASNVITAEYDSLVKKVEVLAEALQCMETELAELKAELDFADKYSGQLLEQIKALENANQVISLSVKESWQQGYQSALVDLHRELGAAANDTKSGADFSQGEEAFAGDGQDAEFFAEFDHTNEDLRKENQSKSFSEDELRDLWKYSFVRSSEEPAEVPKEPEAAKTAHKFVGTKHAQEPNVANIPRSVPHDIRRSCKLLGIKPEEMSKQAVFDAWKREMAKPGVHPDTGGDTEIAMYLNTAKDTLVRYLEAQAPKLGKVFGTGGNREQPAKETTSPKSDTTKPS